MSIVKSISVGHGDMFYIKHNTDNFTIIDCNLLEDHKIVIVNELLRESKGKRITRFISTSPDLDHIRGLAYLDEKIGIRNFYVVKNNAKKNDGDDFDKYCELRDDLKKSYFLEEGGKRRWMNMSDSERQHSGINIYWPITNNTHFISALNNAQNGISPNNISPIFRYAVEASASVIWMGDLEKQFMDLIINDISLPQTDIVIAPHHGRKSGEIPTKFLKELKPKVIIIGEASSDDLHYYEGFNTITQNSAEDITMELIEKKVHFFTSSTSYTVNFLKNENINKKELGAYLGTLNL